MNGVLVFDLSNDLIYKHINGAFKDKVHELALAQGLIAEDAVSSQTAGSRLFSFNSKRTNKISITS
jgi:hypothetical protein